MTIVGDTRVGQKTEVNLVWSFFKEENACNNGRHTYTFLTRFMYKASLFCFFFFVFKPEKTPVLIYMLFLKRSPDSLLILGSVVTSDISGVVGRLQNWAS